MMNKPKIVETLFPSNRCRVHTRPYYLFSCLSCIYIEVDKLISISIDVCTIEKNHAQIHYHYHALMYKKDYFHRHLHPTTSRNDLAIEKYWHTIMHFKSWVMVQSIARMLGCWFDKVERPHNSLSVHL
jgi:hypothetical protein